MSACSWYQEGNGLKDSNCPWMLNYNIPFCKWLLLNSMFSRLRETLRFSALPSDFPDGTSFAFWLRCHLSFPCLSVPCGWVGWLNLSKSPYDHWERERERERECGRSLDWHSGISNPGSHGCSDEEGTVEEMCAGWVCS